MLLVCVTPSIKTGPADPKIPAGFAGIADLLGVPEHSKFALNVAFFVRHRYFLHPKSGNLSKASQETVHIKAVRMTTTSGLTRPQLSWDIFLGGGGLSTLHKWAQQHQRDDLMLDSH